MKAISIISRSIFKKKIASLLIIVQLTISLYMLISCVIQINATSYQENQFRTSFNMNLNRFVHLNILNGEDSAAYRNSYQELQKFVSEQRGVKGVGAYDLTNTSFTELRTNEKFINLRKRLTAGTFKERFPSSIEFLKIEQGTSKIMDLKVVEGRNFMKEDFERTTMNDTIPLLSGSAYRGILSVGMILNDANTKQKFQVIGFLEPGSSWFSDSDYLRMPLEGLDDKFVAPFSEVDNDVLMLLARSNKLFYEMDNKSDFESVKMAVENRAKTLNLRVEIQTVATELDTYKNENKSEITFILVVSSFLGLMTLFGLVSVMLSSIVERKREFGVRIMVGTTMRYIAVLIWGEIFVLTALSACIATIILYYQKRSEQIGFEGIVNQMNDVTLGVLTSALVISFVISLLASLLPIMKLRKLQPREMIGGID